MGKTGISSRIDQISGEAERLSVNFWIGGLYDSKVESEYTDIDSDQDVNDEGLALNLDASWQIPVTGTFGFRLGYDGRAVFYNEFEAYDVLDQTATLEVQWVLGRFMFSLPAGYNYIIEDGHSDYRRLTLSPSCTLLFAQGRQALALFGLYAGIEDKDGAVPDESGVSSGGGCAYVFQGENQARFSLSLAYQLTEYEAVEADYDSCAAHPSRSRQDKASVANVNVSFPLSARLGLYADYTYLNNDSNLPVYDYDRHIIEGGVAIKIF